MELKPLHRYPLRVYYEDTDCGGVVYYANYLRFLERARTEWLRDLGFDAAHWHREGILFTVVEVGIRYQAPAVYGDQLVVLTWLETLAPASFTLGHRIARQGEARSLVTATVRLACISREGRPRRLPEALRTILELQSKEVGKLPKG